MLLLAGLHTTPPAPPPTSVYAVVTALGNLYIVLKVSPLLVIIDPVT